MYGCKGSVVAALGLPQRPPLSSRPHSLRPGPLAAAWLGG